MSTSGKAFNHTTKTHNDVTGKQHVDTVGDIIRNRPCVNFYPRENVRQLIKAMHGRNFGAHGVINAEGKFIGMVTEREILRRLFEMEPETAEQERFAEEEKSLQDLTVWDIMIASPKCLYEDMDVEEAMEEITKRGFRYMPVVSRKDEHELLGIVSERELFIHAKTKAQRELEAKDTLLSYLMHHEPYGLGAQI